MKLMMERGWILKRISGSHHIMFHPESKETLPIPVHGNKDLKTGLFRSLLKKANISIKDI